MKLDYLNNINEYGDNVVRLFNFNKAEAIQFRDLVQLNLLNNQTELPLENIEFIEHKNCTLTLRLSEEDTGIITADRINFYCDLTTEGYEKMVKLMTPFCRKESKAFQMLYDIDNLTDFLFSPAGTDSL